MQGTAKEVTICGRLVKLGDYMEIEYTSGKETKGGRIKGEVIELWDAENHNGHLQGRLSCGWCFHNGDCVITHKTFSES